MCLHSASRPDADIAEILPCKSSQMDIMLVAQWSTADEATIEESLKRLSLYADKARFLGSNLMTDSFLENVMVQKLDHRSNPFSFRPASCHDAVGLCRRSLPAELHYNRLDACDELPIVERDAVNERAMLLTHQMHNCLICQLPLSQPAILLQTEAHASSGWLLQGNCSCRADDSWLRFRGRQNHCTQGLSGGVSLLPSAVRV